ncbi:uncharacterized protein [Maniola hyperantus]|uniref:uncharacterized protein n=1 Tax=Aphantopus hyperantus TaxID=2795564 RepID=UPI001569106A|nr:uncharacterized protein LOC117995704 [Maniola hyperantus]
MEFPEVTRCFGTFPPKYATYLISLFGLGCGGVGLAGIVLFGLIENALIVYITGRNLPMDDVVRKVVLASIGLTSLMLTVANALLFLGATSGSTGALSAGIWVIFAMCLLLIAVAMAGPLSCIFLQNLCIVKKFSTVIMVLGTLVLTVFLEIWLYFMVVAGNYLNQLG